MNLSKPQQLIYDMEKFSGGAIAMICGSMISDGEKDVHILKHGVNEIYRINEALRIRVSEMNGSVCQNVTDYVEQEVEVMHFESKEALDTYAKDYAKMPLDLYGNLCEIKIVLLPGQYGILAKIHHIVGDAWTLALLGTQFHDILDGKKIEAYSYIDYVENEKAYLQSKRYETDKEFFVEQFKKCDEVTYLNEKQSDTFKAERKTYVIDSGQAKQIMDYAKQHDTSPFILFTAALSAYMNRVKMNAEKFYIGTAVLNRNGVKEKNTAGMFINTVPMLMELDNEKTFAQNLNGIQSTVFSVLRHQKYNYGDILTTIRKEYGFQEKLYDVMISYQNAKVYGSKCETTWYHSGEQSESLQIHIDDRDNEGIFRIHYDYLIEKFTEHEIDRLHEHICNLLFDAIENDTKKIYELEILSVNEKNRLLYEFNDTAIDYPRDKCVHQLFEEQVERTPDKVAVVADDKILTYRELNEQANRIAHSLIEKGIGVGDIVAFALSKKSYLIATILGILKSGAAYLPIDSKCPQDRIEYMLSDSNAKLFVRDNDIASLYNEKQNNIDITISRGTCCYCIYTSGSTGKPKGVQISNGNLTNYLESLIDIYGKPHSMPFFTAENVDLTVTSIYLPLITGGKVFLYDNDLMSNLKNIIDNIELTAIKMTPTHMKILNKIENKKQLFNVNYIILGGEQLFQSDVKEFKHYYGNHLKIHNEYGPTETTVGSTNTGVDNARKTGENFEQEKGIDIHIGKPIANTQIYIVDKFMQITPIGVTGELCIAGDGVGAGYLNRPELTVEKFIDNPFGEGKLYKTGDLAYWREDGNIAYVGRNDFQVKIRGLRIELGEIENAICGIEGITQSVVVVRKNDEGRQLICAFYTGVETDAKEIRNYIGKKLPKYMLPHICTHLEEMPLTSSGKINRKDLPEINLQNIATENEYVGPENQQQKELCKLIELVLGTTPVGITDDFFDLGGDSLKAIEFVSKAHNEGIYFSLQNVFDYTTVKELCECVAKGNKQEISFADVDFTEVNAILEKNKLEHIKAPVKTEIGNILLAGATGYLGIHILADYLDNDTGTAYCLVRGKNTSDSTKRLQELLSFYFGDKYADIKRIKVICADLQQNNFGLSEDKYNELVKSVDIVINSAASVKHYGTYKYFYEINVEAVKSLIKFCKQSTAKLIHISTLSVSGSGFNNELITTEKNFTESDLYINQPLENVYARSKFEAEKEILNAMVDGLQANIMRMGNLTNRYSDGVFQINYQSNAFLNRVKTLLKLKVFPTSIGKTQVDFTFVDEAARAIMTIAHHFDGVPNVFHICNPKTISITDLFGNVGMFGYKIKEVNDDEFYEHLQEMSRNEEMKGILETFINDMDENDQLNYDSNIRIENDFTVQYLKNLCFEWSDIDIEYLRKYVEYFKSIGFLN